MQVARQDAHDRVAWVVAGARAGAGRALVVAGDPGAGKSWLLQDGLAPAGDLVQLRVTGAPVEQGLAHAGLHALLRPLVPLLDALPGVQRQALEVVLGLSAGAPPTPFLVGAATLSLLAAQAESAPVVVVVDDAQWVDEASVQALAFAGRRLAGERVGMLMAARAAEVPASLDGLDLVTLGPLTPEEAARMCAGLAPSVAAALVTATGGNALALVERLRGLDEAQRAGAVPLPVDEDAVFVQEVRTLPRDVLEAAALAALAADVPPAVLVAARKALAVTDLAAAEDVGLLVATAEGVRWRHPLARAAVLDAVPPRRQRALSAALADAAAAVGASTAVVVELRLAAVAGPDEVLAADLEGVAAAATQGGDHARAARLWARSADVGIDAARHGARLFSAADALHAAGRLGRARELYDAAQAAGLDDRARALTHLALGRIEHTAGSPRRALHELAAAASCAPERALRVRACAEGVLAAMYAGVPAVAAQLAAQADAAHDPDDRIERLLVLHARGAAAALAGDLEAARPLLAAAVVDPPLEEQPDLVLWVITAALFSGADADAGLEMAAPAVDRLRLSGDLTWLPRVVRLWGVRHELAGRWLVAYATFEEAVELSRAAEQTTQLVEALRSLASLEALRGEREACLGHCAEAEQLLARLDVPFLASAGWWARGLLHLGLDEPSAAAAALAPAVDLPGGVRFREEAVADLVEALVLDARVEEAAEAARLAPSARAAGVLETDDGQSVRLLLEAAAQGSDPVTQARCRLLAGERLRRTGHRIEARQHLRAAADVFTRAGAAPWLRRAEEGLRASGGTLSARDERPEALTGAELRVAALVAEGRPTREVAALLFLSPKTVEFHLGRIYRKLGVRGRADLARVLAPGSG